MLSECDPGTRQPTQVISQRWNQEANLWSEHRVFDSWVVTKVRSALEPHLAALDPGKDVLEINCGANNLVYYPPDLNPWRIWPLDVSPEMITLNPCPLAAIWDVRKGPLPFHPSLFGLATSIFGMRYYENQESVALNTLDAISPGGKAVFIDFAEAQHELAVRRFDPHQLSKSLLTERPNLTITTDRLSQGSPWESPIEMLTIQAPLT
jgi:hypothetical protein